MEMWKAAFLDFWTETEKRYYFRSPLRETRDSAGEERLIAPGVNCRLCMASLQVFLKSEGIFAARDYFAGYHLF